MAIGIAKGTWNWLPFGIGNYDYGLTEKFVPQLPKNPAFAQPIGPESMKPGQQTAYGQVMGTQSGPGGAYPIAEPKPQYPTNTTPTGDVPTNNPPDSGGYSGPSAAELAAQKLNESYNSLYSDLDSQLESLLGTKTSQEEQVGRTYDTSLGNLKSERDLAMGQIESTKARSLEDIGDSLRNMWSQGNRVLGSRGASDSSATNQYNYAITKLGSKARGNLNYEYANRINTLQQLWSKNISQLENDKINQIQSISDWYNQQVQQIRTTRAGLQAQKSQQILDIALQELQSVKNTIDSRRTALENWALSKAQTYQQAAKALGLTSEGLPTFSGSLNQGMDYATTGNKQYGFGNFGDNDSDYLKQLAGY